MSAARAEHACEAEEFEKGPGPTVEPREAPLNSDGQTQTLPAAKGRRHHGRHLRMALAWVLHLLAPAVGLVYRGSSVLLLAAMSAWCIYWLPYVPVGPFQTAKDIVLCSAVAAVWVPVIYASLARFSHVEQLAPREAGGPESSRGLRVELPAKMEQPRSRLAIRPWTPEALLLVALCLATLPGIIFSPAPLASLQYWWRIAAALVLFLTFRQALADGRLRPELAFTVLVLPATLSAAGLLLGTVVPQIAKLRPIGSHYAGLARAGLSSVKTGFAWETALAAPLAWGLLAKAERWAAKVLLAVALLILLGGIALSAGRGGLLAVALAGGIIALWYSRKALAVYILVLALLAAGAASLWSTTLEVRYLKLSPRKHLQLPGLEGTPLGTLDSMAGGRVGIAIAGARVALQYPLTGIGFGQFEPLSYKLLPIHNDVHNLYLALAAESGLASALAAVAFSAWCLLFGAKAARALSTSPWFHLAVAAQALTLVGLFQTLFERGDLFCALHAGLPFWMALACLREARDMQLRKARAA